MLRLSAFVLGFAVFSSLSIAQAPNTPPQSPEQRGERRMPMRDMGSERFLGPILEAAPDHLVILRPDTDAKITVVPASDARLIKDQTMGAKLSDFQVGDYAMVAGDMNGGKLEAKLLASNAQQSQNLRQNLGKTMVMGRVVSVDLDHASMKIHRVDGQDQTVQADENSSFHRGGMRQFRGGEGRGGDAGNGNAAATTAAGPESITMADLKPGDYVMARGALKSDVFTVSDLNVMPRGGMMFGGGMRRPEGDAQQPKPPQ